MKNSSFLAVFLALAVLLSGCAAPKESKDPVVVYKRESTLNTLKPSAASASAERMGFTIQAGAFSMPENAVRMTNSLDAQGLEPYFFRDTSSGLFKVRFGNFSSRNAATERAEALKEQGIIKEYFIFSPDSYTAVQTLTLDGKAKSAFSDDVVYLRGEIAKTARAYIGVPYLWGGEGTDGIDCSGLTQAVYSLNGLSLPRNSTAQYAKGRSVPRKDLAVGDLVFFKTRSGKAQVSHVGIYVGEDKFIHAPSRGKNVTVSSLDEKYYDNAYVGARSYL